MMKTDSNFYVTNKSYLNNIKEMKIVQVSATITSVLKQKPCLIEYFKKKYYFALLVYKALCYDSRPDYPC